MRTVGWETSRLRPWLRDLVGFELFLLVFSAVVFDRPFVDLLLMSLYWARMFWYTGILEQTSLALLLISDFWLAGFFFHNRLEFKCAHFLQDYALMSGSYDDNIKTGDGGGESGIIGLSIHSCGLLQTCCELALLYMHHIWVTLTSISHEIVSAIIWTSWEDSQSLCIFTRNSSTCSYDGWFSSSSLYV